MTRKYDTDSQIIFVDSKGEAHSALATVWWDTISTYRSDQGEPGCNVVYVSTDTSKTDPYGRQIEKATSVVHKMKQAAPGNFWCWPDEFGLE